MTVELRDHLDPAAVVRLESLEIVARTLVEGFLKGLHFSAAKGSSIEFAEHRPYVPGDDIRRIDWRTFGRTDRFYLKEYDDETNLRGIILLDASGSMGFGSGEVTKLRYAVCLAATVGYLLITQRDAVGLALAGARLTKYVPPKTTPQHLRGVFSALDAVGAEGETRLADCIHRVAERAHSRSMVVILSDFLDDPRAITTSVAHLRHRGAEALLFHILDPAEEEFPFTNWTVFEDSESRSHRLRLDARQVRDVYQENLAEHVEVLRRGCAALETDYCVFNTKQPFETALARYLDRRGKSAR